MRFDSQPHSVPHILYSELLRHDRADGSLVAHRSRATSRDCATAGCIAAPVGSRISWHCELSLFFCALGSASTTNVLHDLLPTSAFHTYTNTGSDSSLLRLLCHGRCRPVTRSPPSLCSDAPPKVAVSQTTPLPQLTRHSSNILCVRVIDSFERLLPLFLALSPLSTLAHALYSCTAEFHPHPHPFPSPSPSPFALAPTHCPDASAKGSELNRKGFFWDS